MGNYNLGEARGKIVLETDLTGLKDAQKALDASKTGAEDAANSQQKAWGKVGTAALVAGASVAAGFAVAVGAASNFEAQLSGIQAVSGATASEMDLIRDAALRIGKDTAFSASDAAQAMEELSKAGISTKDILNGAADATVALAAAGGVDLPTAATIAANAMNQFNLNATDLVGVTDRIAGAANASAIDMGQFAQSMGQVGAVANLAGLSFDDTALAIAAMGNAGIVGSDAGTSLKTMLMNLQPATASAAAEMEKLGLITADGKNQFYDAQGSLKSLADISSVLGTALNGMTDAQKQATLVTLFGTDAVRGAAIVANTGADGFNELSAAMDKTSAADVAATRMDNMKGSTEQLMGSLETLFIAIGTTFIPVLREMIDQITVAVNWFTNLDDKTRNMVVGATLLAGGLLLAFGAFIKIGQAVAAARAAYTALGIAQGLLNAKTIISNTVTAVGTGILIAQSAAQKAAAAAQWLLNAAMSANPIGLIIAAVVALVAGLIWFFTQTELGRAIWAGFVQFLTDAWNGLVAVAQVVWGAIMTAIGAVVDWFQTYVWPIIQFVIDLIIAYFMMYYNVIMFVWNGVMAVVGAVVDWFMGHVWPVIQAFVGLIVAIFGLLQDLVTLAWMAISDFITTIVTAIVAWAVGVWTEFANFWRDVWTAISNFLLGIWNGIVAFMTPIVMAIVGFLVDTWNNFLRGWNILWLAVQIAFQTIWNAIKSFVEPIVRGIVNFITSTWSGITSFVSTTFNNVKDAIMNPINDALKFIGGIKDKVIGFFSGAGSWLLHAGESIIRGFIDGLNNMLGEVGNFFRDLTNSIPDLKGPPPRDAVLLYDNGALIMKSLANGLASEMGGVESLLTGMNSTIPMTLQQDINANVNANANNGKAPIVLNLEYHAAPGDGTQTKADVLAMLGHATELVREELS